MLWYISGCLCDILWYCVLLSPYTIVNEMYNKPVQPVFKLETKMSSCRQVVNVFVSTSYQKAIIKNHNHFAWFKKPTKPPIGYQMIGP